MVEGLLADRRVCRSERSDKALDGCSAMHRSFAALRMTGGRGGAQDDNEGGKVEGDKEGGVRTRGERYKSGRGGSEGRI